MRRGLRIGNVRHARARVYAAMCAAPNSAHYILPLWRSTHVKHRTLSRVLEEMLDAGWLEDHWEEGVRNPRRYFTVTELGYERMHA